MSDRDRAISDIAYRIWEEAGRPEGQDDRHWHAAQRRYDAERSDVKAKPAKGKDSKLKRSERAKLNKGVKPDKVADPAGADLGAVAARGGKARQKAKTAEAPAAPKTAEVPKPKGAGKANAKPAPAEPAAASPKTASATKT